MTEYTTARKVFSIPITIVGIGLIIYSLINGYEIKFIVFGAGLLISGIISYFSTIKIENGMIKQYYRKTSLASAEKIEIVNRPAGRYGRADFLEVTDPLGKTFSVLMPKEREQFLAEIKTLTRKTINSRKAGNQFSLKSFRIFMVFSGVGLVLLVFIINTELRYSSIYMPIIIGAIALFIFVLNNYYNKHSKK